MDIVVFSSETDYNNYDNTHKVTGGEADDTIENNSISSEYVHSNEMCSINLEDGMILFVQDGIIEYLVAKGPVIN